MTRCELIGTLLAGHVTGEITPFERALVVEHLAESEVCRAELAHERRLRDAMEAVPAVACPDNVTAAITAAVDAESAVFCGRDKRARRRPFIAAAFGVAAAVTLMLLLPGHLGHPAANDADTWTRSDLDRGRRDLQRVLAVTADIIDRTEKQSISNVLRHLQTHTGPALDNATPDNPGGQG